VIDWSGRDKPLVDALQQFQDHPGKPQRWQNFVNSPGQTDTERNPNSRIRATGTQPGG